MQARATPATWLTPALRRDLIAVLAVGLFLSFTDPFQATRNLPEWSGVLYWTALVGEGWFGSTLIEAVLSRRFPRMPALLRWTLTVVVVAVLVTATILLVQQAIGRSVPTSFWITLYGLVLGVTSAITAVGWLVERAFDDARPGAVTHAPSPGGATQSVRFLDRLPAKLKGGALYAVSSEDHYLRLHTSKGSDLILMRLSDAIAELEGVEGAQTHRSWWVARDAVEDVRRDGDKVILRLNGGIEAPVSRPNVRALREAGWF